MLQRLSQNPFLFFVITLGASLGASVIFAQALHALLPVEGMWIIAGITSLIVTIIIFSLRQQVSWPNETLTLLISASASLIITMVAGVIQFGTIPPLPPGDQNEIVSLSTRVTHLEAKLKDVESDLQRIGLTVAQIQEIQATYVRNGHLTVADLIQMGLNQTQMQQVEALLSSKGFMTIAQATEAAAQATKAAICYVQPLDSNVNVRKTPKVPGPGEEDNYLTLLSPREVVRVIGHNGGGINSTRWWLIELSSETDEIKQQGWVASFVVKEINLSACENLPQYAR